MRWGCVLSLSLNIIFMRWGCVLSLSLKCILCGWGYVLSLSNTGPVSPVGVRFILIQYRSCFSSGGAFYPYPIQVLFLQWGCVLSLPNTGALYPVGMHCILFISVEFFFIGLIDIKVVSLSTNVPKFKVDWHCIFCQFENTVY